MVTGGIDCCQDRQNPKQRACRIAQQDNLTTQDGGTKQAVNIKGEAMESAQTSLKAAGINKEQVYE